jgi:vacuolar-type H+-ATPase subunit H
MANDILREIICVEKELQQSLEQAKEMTRAWLETRSQELDGLRAREEEEIAASYRQAREKLTREAANRADDLVKGAEQQADRIMRLENDTLARIVVNHISTILPGEP